MDISDAFMADSIEAAGVTPSDEELTELRTWLGELATEVIDKIDGMDTLDIPAELTTTLVDSMVELASMAFVAGRAYEEQFNNVDSFPIDMDRATLTAFVRYLASNK